MKDQKYTDEQIIKALECCAVDPHSGKFADCKNCPLDYLKTANCFEYEIQIIALDLINRQRAEIERLSHKCDDCAGCTQWICDCANIEAEAIKEFAERAKEIKVKYALPLLGLQTKDEIERYVDDILMQMRDGIDRLVKEMTEGKQ